MLNSLRCMITKLKFKGKITELECDELLNKLDNHDKELIKETERRNRMKVCCNCKHNIRIKEVNGRIKCECEIDNSYIGYVACMTYKCDKWESDEEYWKEMKGDTE